MTAEEKRVEPLVNDLIASVDDSVWTRTEYLFGFKTYIDHSSKHTKIEIRAYVWNIDSPTFSLFITPSNSKCGYLKISSPVLHDLLKTLYDKVNQKVEKQIESDKKERSSNILDMLGY